MHSTSRILSLCFVVFLMSVGSALAGKYNPVLTPGDKSPVWKKLPGIDGKKHSLADLKKKDVVVVVFTCNSCDYAIDYEERIKAFTKKYAGSKKSRVAMVAICVNKIKEDLLPALKARAKKKKFNFIYLYDGSQKIARQFGAIRTPEFFVLDKKRRVVYMGAMDDSTDAKKVKLKFLEEAVDATLKGSKFKVKETVAIGCTIRFKRTRRKRKK
jgi:peroxiredoxin